MGNGNDLSASSLACKRDFEEAPMNLTPLTWSLLTPEDPQYGRSLTGEVLGVRVLPDGRREYLCMNKALDPQRYYVMDSL